MPKTQRTITPDASGDTALTMAELINITGESDRSLRGKIYTGQFKGAYRTDGGRGPWRIPLRSLRAYQKARSVTTPEKEP